VLILANNDYQIFTMPATGGQRFQVTPNTAKPLECSSTGPRGSHIVYSGYDGSDYEIFTIPANGGTPVQQVTFNNRRDSDPSFTAVGQHIAYSGDSSGPYWGEIFTIPVNGGTPTQLTFSTHTADIDPDYRPDGQMIVYSHLERGSHNNPLDYEIQTTPATGGPGGQSLTSNSSNIDDLAPSTRPTGNRSPIRAPAASATAPTTRSSRCPLPEGRPSKSHSTTQTTAVLPGSPESGSIRFANSSSRPQEVGIGPRWRGEALGVPRPDERGG
jgi:Tol biopolymer transport system component